VAAAFLDHRLGQRATATRHTRHYLDRFLAEYLTRKGAGWVAYGAQDRARTRQAYDAVRAAVDAVLASAAEAGDDGPLIASPAPPESITA
jgi:hypothetical protein